VLEEGPDGQGSEFSFRTILKLKEGKKELPFWNLKNYCKPLQASDLGISGSPE